jgi:hypothetical protein
MREAAGQAVSSEHLQEVQMRHSTVAIALMICLAPADWIVAAETDPPTPGAPGNAPAGVPAPSVPPPADSPAAAADAAARHAKRTACLKEAKSKKLLGAERTAYVKNCVESSRVGD